MPVPVPLFENPLYQTSDSTISPFSLSIASRTRRQPLMMTIIHTLFSSTPTASRSTFLSHLDVPYSIYPISVRHIPMRNFRAYSANGLMRNDHRIETTTILRTCPLTSSNKVAQRSISQQIFIESNYVAAIEIFGTFCTHFEFLRLSTEHVNANLAVPRLDKNQNISIASSTHGAPHSDEPIQNLPASR